MSEKLKNECPYGEKCYRRNLQHFKTFAHPILTNLLQKQTGPDLIIPEDWPYEQDPSCLFEQLQVMRVLEETMADENPNKASADQTVTSSSQIVASTSRKRPAADESVSSSDEQEGLMRRNQAIAEMQKRHCLIPEYTQYDMQKFHANPYKMFLTRVERLPETYNDPYTISFVQMLDPQFGKIEKSLLFTFCLELGWICAQYMLAKQAVNLTVLCNDHDEDLDALPRYIKLVKVKVKYAFGSHHTKMMMHKYTDGSIRIIITTANLAEDDWELRTQGVWISPALPKLSVEARSLSGESPTGFKNDILKYLKAYNIKELNEWISLILRADCSKIDVFFVGSVPGNYGLYGKDNSWGHLRVGKLLADAFTLPEDDLKWDLLASVSSIGKQGPDYNSWLGKNFVNALSKATNDCGIKQPINEFRLIYPSEIDVEGSLDDEYMGNCLMYTRERDQEQMWLRNHMYKWRANCTQRSTAMPHIKSYTRISRCNEKLGWVILTSANLSKAAWGYNFGSNYQLLNYEAGVLFLPEYVIQQSYFPTRLADTQHPFPLPYDLPLTKYGENDKPFFDEVLP